MMPSFSLFLFALPVQTQHGIVQDSIGTYLSKMEGVKKEIEERDKALERYQDKKKEYSTAQTKEKDPSKLQQLKDKFQSAKEGYDEANDKTSNSLNRVVEQACDDIDPAYQRLISMHSKLFTSMGNAFDDMGDGGGSSSFRSQPSPRGASRPALAPPTVLNPDSLSPPERPARTSVYGMSPSAIESGGNPPLPSRSAPVDDQEFQPRLPARGPTLPSRDQPPISPRDVPPSLPQRDSAPSLPQRDSAPIGAMAAAGVMAASQPPLPSRNRASVYGVDGNSIQQEAPPGEAPPTMPTRVQPPTRPGPSPSQPPLPNRGLPPTGGPPSLPGRDNSGPPSLPGRDGSGPPSLPGRDNSGPPSLPGRDNSAGGPPSLPGRENGGAPSLPGRGYSSSSAPAPAPAPVSAAAIPAGLVFPTSVIPEEEQKKYSLIFKREDPEDSGQITGLKAIGLFGRSGLTQPELALIWELADQNKDGSLSKEEFVIAMFLINSKLMGRIPEIPDELPADLVINNMPGHGNAPAASSAPPAMPARAHTQSQQYAQAPQYGQAPQQYGQSPAYGAPSGGGQYSQSPAPGYGGGGAPSLPNRGGPTSPGGPSLPSRGPPPSQPQTQGSLRSQMDQKADDIGAQMRQKAQQST